MKRPLFACTAALLISGTASANLIITEYLADPLNSIDNVGEYFEVYNTGAPINIADLTIGDDDGQSINLVGQTGVIGTGQFFVFGPSSQSYIDFDYSSVPGTFYLSNSIDEIVITRTSNATELARVDFADGDRFGDGIAHELVNINLGSSTTGPTGGTDYIAATNATLIGNGDKGSPGEAGNTVVPEPTSLALLGLGGLLLINRRRNHRP